MLKGTFAADFEPFYTAVAKAETTLKSFESGAGKVGSSLDKMTNSFSGKKVLEEAALMERALEQLAKDGVNVRVIDAYSIKPIDADGIRAAARATGDTVLTVEDHYDEGGLGDAVLNAVAGDGIKVSKLAVRDIPRSGKPEELLKMFEIDAAAIVKRVRELVSLR